MQKIIKKLQKLGLSRAQAVSDSIIVGVSFEEFRALKLCPFSDLPKVDGFWIDWQNEYSIVCGRE